MSLRALLFLVFTILLAAVFAGIVGFYYGRRRLDRVERPKYRMLEDDGNPPGPSGGNGKG